MKTQATPQPVSRTICYKLECIGDFLASYVSSISSSRYCYLELFSRPGDLRCRDTGAMIHSSTSRVLGLKPAFGQYILVARDHSSRACVVPGSNTLVVANNLIYNKTLQHIVDAIPRSHSIFALIDAPGYRDFRWSTIKKLTGYGTDWQGYRMDMLLVLPVGTALYNNLARPECTGSITRFFGSGAWKDFFNEMEAGALPANVISDKLVAFYTANLKKLGYHFVEHFRPAKFSGSPGYYVVWASDRDSRLKLIKYIWNKTRFIPGEFFHSQP